MRLLTRGQAYGLAVVIALVVAGLVYLVLSRQARAPEPVVPQTVSVVVATQDIPALTTITAEMVTTKTMDVGTAPAGALSNVQQVIGQLAQANIVKDQPLTQANIALRTASHGLTFVIPQGLRAVTVALDAISGVGGFIFPGDRVDVLVTFKQDDITLTKTILQNVEVLAINELTTRPGATRQPGPSDEEAQPQQDQKAEAPTAEAPTAEAVRSATLAVTPDQAEALILSAVKGTIHLVLRPREDVNIVSLPGKTDYALMGVPPPAKESEKTAEGTEATAPTPMMAPVGWPAGMSQPPVAPGGGAAPSGGAAGRGAAAQAPHTVEVIRGSEREIVTP